MDIVFNSNIVIWSLATYTAYLVGLAIYRLFLSPIAHFPGSKLTALTGWYETYLDVFQGGQFIFKIEKWHQQYGPIIRINPWEVHIADPDFYDVLYSTRSRNNKPKAWQYRFGLPLSTFDVIEHNDHHRRRQAIAPFFTRLRVLDFLPYIQSCVDKMCERFEKEYRGKGQHVSLDEAYAALTSDVINYYSFALSYNFLDYPNFETPFTTSIRKLAMSLHLSGHFPWFLSLMQSLPKSWVAVLNPDMKPVQDFHGEVRNQIERIVTGENTSHKSSAHLTVFNELLESSLRPEEKTIDLLHQEAASITGAGIETTKTALAVASFHIMNNESVHQRLKTELRAAMPEPSTAPLSLTQLEKLPYLYAVVQESLRLSFGISQRLVRINPHSPIKYDDSFVIPPGVPFSMTSYLQHRDPRIFPDPDEFRPERWITSDDNKGKNPLLKYLVPFGRGPRMCLGMNLAMAELYLVIAHVFCRFDMELFGTKRNAVDMAADYFIPIPEKGTKGVRVLIN